MASRDNRNQLRVDTGGGGGSSSSSSVGDHRNETAAPVDEAYYEDYQKCEDEDDDDGEGFSSELLDRNQMASSFRTSHYHSEEMKKILDLELNDDKQHAGLNDVSYKSSKIFPEWCLKSYEWRRSTDLSKAGNEIAEIFQMPANQRSNEQRMTLINFIISVWPNVAGTMGIKRVGMMVKEFKYLLYEPNTNIVTEGETGHNFYIIISGEVDIIKDGVGKVGHMGKGKSFGELALTQYAAKRAATIRSCDKVEVLSLHKIDYDHFVKDIQFNERREHFQLLRDCHLFGTWPRAKIEKMAATTSRKVYEAGWFIFHQGDEPDNLYFILEGSVRIIKEIQIICKNRWPSGPESWAESKKTNKKPIIINTLHKGGYFGELAILQKVRRTASAVAVGKCTLVSIDKQEFLHQLVTGVRAELRNDLAKHYITDKDVLKVIDHVPGGPSSLAIAGEVVKYPNAAKIIKINDDVRKTNSPNHLKTSLPDSDTNSLNSELIEQQMIHELHDKINKSTADAKKSKKKKLVLEGQPNMIKQILIREINDKLTARYDTELSAKRAEAEQELYKVIKDQSDDLLLKKEKEQLLKDYEKKKRISTGSSTNSQEDSTISEPFNRLSGAGKIQHTSIKFGSLPVVKTPNKPHFAKELEFKPISFVPYKPVSYDHVQGKLNINSSRPGSPDMLNTNTSEYNFNTKTLTQQTAATTAMSNISDAKFSTRATRTSSPTATSLSGAIIDFEKLPSPTCRRLHSASSASLTQYEEHQKSLHDTVTISPVHKFKEKKRKEEEMETARRARVLSQHLSDHLSKDSMKINKSTGGDNHANSYGNIRTINVTANATTIASTAATAGELIVSKDPRTPVFRTRGKIEEAVFGESTSIRPAYQPSLRLLHKHKLSYADIMCEANPSFLQAANV